eukprot:XP_024451952.1 uncharacterized protein LOC7480673 [Populus trichocarpa]
MEEESLQVRLPSPTEFASEIESKNVSAVFNGCIKNWKAFVEWNPANGGLDYLQDHLLWKLCYLKQHLYFTVISEAMKGYQDAVTDVEPSLLSGDALRQIYVAQLFYAPLLQVHFLPKACVCSVALENPDFSLYPRAKCSMDYAQKVFLHADDALFIPEGWTEPSTPQGFSWLRETGGIHVSCSVMEEEWEQRYLHGSLMRLINRQQKAIGTNSTKAFMVHLMINLLHLLTG